jgi:hypothetical protein
MTVAKPTFGQRTQRSRLFRVAQRAVIIVTLLFVAIGIGSSYNAWVQVRALDVMVASPNLRPGLPAIVHVVSSGRAFVTVKLELVQGTHSETLAELRIAPNRWSMYDLRARPATMAPAFTAEFLAHFQAGPAVLRATGTGAGAWLRIPPPVIKEVAVVVSR